MNLAMRVITRKPKSRVANYRPLRETSRVARDHALREITRSFLARGRQALVARGGMKLVGTHRRLPRLELPIQVAHNAHHDVALNR